MRPPLKIELWDANGNARLLNVAMGVEAAMRVCNESVDKLRTGEVIRVRDANGALLRDKYWRGRGAGVRCQLGQARISGCTVIRRGLNRNAVWSRVGERARTPGSISR